MILRRLREHPRIVLGAAVLLVLLSGASPVFKGALLGIAFVILVRRFARARGFVGWRGSADDY